MTEFLRVMQRIVICRAVVVGMASMWAMMAHSITADRNVRLFDTYAAIDRVLVTSSMPGLVVGITDRTHTLKIIVHGFADMKARIPLTASSLFAIGSVSKGFTAVALMQLMEEGRFDPRVPITRYLPSFTIRSTFPPITGHNLLSHTSGLPNYIVDASSSRYVLVKLRDFKPTYAPGTHWWYSNTGFQLLGYVLEDIEGQPYPAVIQHRIFDRLDMTSTAAVIDDEKRKTMAVSYTRWPDDGSYVEATWFEYTAGDGSVVSNAADMCAYMRLILNRGVGPHGRVLSEKAFAKLTSPVLADYAYGLQVASHAGSTVISHSGGIAGFVSEVEAHMEDGFAVVLLSNGGIDPGLQSWIISAIAAAYHGEPLPTVPIPKKDRARPRVEQYAGVYRSIGRDNTATNSTIEFVAAAGKLEIKDGYANVPLEILGTDTFRDPRPGSGSLPFFFSRAEGQNEGKVAEVSRGASWYVNNNFAGSPRSLVVRAYDAYVGHYESAGPEGPAARIFVRNGRLTASLSEDELPQALEPTDVDGVFRFAKPAYSPEYFHFGSVIEGHALRLDITGVALYRKDTP